MLFYINICKYLRVKDVMKRDLFIFTSFQGREFETLYTECWKKTQMLAILRPS